MTERSSADTRVVVIDDHASVRESIRALLESADFQVADYPSASAFLAAGGQEQADCLLVDIRMPGMSGLELQEELARRGNPVPVIIITGHGDVPLAVRAMRLGAFDFVEKPFEDEVLLASIGRATREGLRARDRQAEARAARDLLDLLTERERDVLARLALGESNKAIAHGLGISPRTVEIHRARVMDKMKARSVADLVRMVRTAERQT